MECERPITASMQSVHLIMTIVSAGHTRRGHIRHTIRAADLGVLIGDGDLELLI